MITVETPDKKDSETASLLQRPGFVNAVSSVVIAAAGFVLLNLAFLLNYLVFRLVDMFTFGRLESASRWLPLTRHVLFLVIIVFISWIVFRSRLPVLVKASYVTVPTAVALATTGVLLYPSPFLPCLVGGLLTVAALFYFYRTSQPWLYYYSVILTALVLMIFTLVGGEI